MKPEQELDPLSSKEKWRQRGLDAQAFIIKHWLPLVFAVAIIVALAWPAPGVALLHVTILGDVRIIQEVAIGIVFFISGLCLNTQDVKKAKGHVFGVAFGFISILFLTPLLGFVMRELPLEPKLFSIGLTMFCVAPTTLGVGVALVRSCKGNDGIALLMTVGTNFLAVVTMPLMLKLLFLNYDLTGINIKVDILSLFLKLIITILAPSVVGKVLREVWARVPPWTNRYKVHLNILSTTLLAFIIWQTMSGARDLLFDSAVGMVLSVICISIGLYLIYLAIHFVIISLLFRMPTPEAISVIIMSSQKSAPVAVTVISYITADPSTQGLLALPCIVGQLAQIFLGAGMAVPIARRADAYQERQQKPTEDRSRHPPAGGALLGTEGQGPPATGPADPDIEAPEARDVTGGPNLPVALSPELPGSGLAAPTGSVPLAARTGSARKQPPAGENNVTTAPLAASTGGQHGAVEISEKALTGPTARAGAPAGVERMTLAEYVNHPAESAGNGPGEATAAGRGIDRQVVASGMGQVALGSMGLRGAEPPAHVLKRGDSRVRGSWIGLAALMWPKSSTETSASLTSAGEQAATTRLQRPGPHQG